MVKNTLTQALKATARIVAQKMHTLDKSGRKVIKKREKVSGYCCNVNGGGIRKGEYIVVRRRG